VCSLCSQQELAIVSFLVKCILSLANQEGDFVLRSPRIVGEAGFTLHEIRATKARTANGSLGICL
jgi:hypothetical protein